MRTFRLPDLGEGLQDAEIVSWHISAGDRVVADQPLVSVETEKAVVEVPAPWSGRVVSIHGTPGDLIAIGEPLAEFDLEETKADAGTVVGDLPQAPPKSKRPAPREDAMPPHVKATPAVRALARKRGVNIAAIIGTGPGGSISLSDVEDASAQTRAGEFQPLLGARRTMARNMAAAHAEIVPTTVSDEAIIEAWPSNADVTMRLVRAIVAACQAEPALNAWYEGDRRARLVHDKIDLGIAVNTNDGLFVPVLRDAGNRDEAELRTGFEAMKRDVTARSIPPQELQGQTITLSNFGMIGGRHAALVVMPPQVAILGAGRITTEPRVSKGKIVASKVLPLSLTFDHRAVSGAEATRFLMAAIANLER